MISETTKHQINHSSTAARLALFSSISFITLPSFFIRHSPISLSVAILPSIAKAFLAYFLISFSCNLSWCSYLNKCESAPTTNPNIDDEETKNPFIANVCLLFLNQLWHPYQKRVYQGYGMEIYLNTGHVACAIPTIAAPYNVHLNAPFNPPSIWIRYYSSATPRNSHFLIANTHSSLSLFFSLSPRR